MIRRSLLIGLGAGVLISIAGVYPIISLLAPLVLSGWERPVMNELIHAALLMGSALVGFPPLLLVGVMAARSTEAKGWQKGGKVGLIAGLTTGMFIFLTLVSPVNALLAYGNIVGYQPSATMPLPPGDALTAYLFTFEQGIYAFELTLFLAAVVWGVQGMYVGWRQRSLPEEERPSLITLIKQDASPRAWFRGNEAATRAGLIVGAFVGSLVILAIFGQFYVGFSADWPELSLALQQAQTSSMYITGPVIEALPVLWPLLSILLLTFGALVVILIKNPPNRFLARAGGIFLASHAIGFALTTVVLRISYFNMGLAPYGLFRWMQQNPAEAAQMPEDAVLFMETLLFLQKPSTFISTVLILPWVMLLIAVLFSLLIAVAQSLVYIPLVSTFLKRPVDEAAEIQHRFKQDPNNILPDVYRAFDKLPNVYEVLAHVSVCSHKSEPDLSRLAAAWHTLGTSSATAEYIDSVDAVQEVLLRHPQWRWSADFGAVYHALHEVLNAGTLDGILSIEPPPAQQTSSLPPVMVKSVQYIKRVVSELHKVNRVEDLSTKLIFLENSLEAIHEAQRFVNEGLVNSADARVPMPEKAALISALDHWQELVLTAVKRLKGRADVISELENKQCNRTSTLPLIFTVANHGLNVAQQVHMRLLPGQSYLPNGDDIPMIDILPPGESQQVTVSVTPRETASRLRVEWEITYHDAVDADRRVTFADVVEFDEPDKPFQRIFPIPYVTGTPLKTNDVFVGREDVFTFIRENLVGAHQNNVIILHGQRRTGKTSVLYRLGQVMTDTHYGVLIDMQGKPARGELDFLYSIADDIVFALEDHEIFVDLPARAEFEEAGPEFYFRSRFVRSLSPHLNGKNLLLMFDEFEELQRRVEDGRLQPEIFQFLRNLMQHEDHIDFVFSGTHKLEDLGAEYWSVLFNIAAYKPITFLSPAEVERLILAPVAEYNIEYDPFAIDRIIHVGAGHPYFTQLILHEMIVYHNETQRNYLTAADVNQVLDRIVERGEAHFKYIWSESSEEERVMLQGFTELMMGEKPATLEDLRTFLTKNCYNSADNWQRALANLEGRDILTRQNPRSQLFRFKVDLIRLWIERTRPSL